MSLHLGYVLKMYPRLSETFIVNEILELERQGARVTVFSLRTPREGRFHEKLARVAADVVYLPDVPPADLLARIAAARDRLDPVRHELGRLLWEEIERTHTPSVKALGKALVLLDEARARGIDHLHAHFATSAADAARACRRLGGPTYSITAHAKDIYLHAHDAGQMQRRLADAAFLVTVCDANVPALEAACAGSVPVHRIYNGLDLSEFAPAGGPDRPDDEALRVVGVGRLVPKKGFDDLLRATRHLVNEGLAVRCRIVGDGAERGALESLADELELRGHVDFLGAVPNGRVRDELRAADVMALPCRVADDGNRDALPTVLLEALALGVPFVSTPVTGIPEIAGKEDGGILVPEGRADRLAVELARLAGAPELRAELGRRGRARAERLFDGTANVRALLDRFESVAAQPAREGEPCMSSL